MNDSPMQAASFQEQAAANFIRRNPDLAGGVIYEIGSDPSMLAGAAMRREGARIVLATNIEQGWHRAPPPGVVALSCDIRQAGQTIGRRSVDAVFGINILEHVKDMADALAAIREILRPGGRFHLHGHPIWSGPTGHHGHWMNGLQTFHFQDSTSPLPPWGHLYMTEAEVIAHTTAIGYPAEAQAYLVRDIFYDGGINRLPLRAIDAAFRASGLVIDDVYGNGEVEIDDPTRALVMESQWWDAAENYAVRQVTYAGHRDDV